MKRILLSLAIAAMMGIYTEAQAQEINPEEEIIDQVGDTEAAELNAASKAITAANQSLVDAERSMQKATEIRNNAAKEKKGKQKKLIKQAEAMEAPIYQKQINAYKQLSEGYKRMYTTYYKDLSQKYTSCPQSKKNRVDDLMGLYEEKWDEALNTLRKVPTDKKADPKTAVKIYKTATEYQQEAIDAQQNAYGEILGWFDKKEEPKEETTAKEETTFASTPAAEATPAKSSAKIHYKVQIAADVAPLNLDFIKKYVYDTDEVINNEYTDGTYRYLIGRFGTYEEALEAKARMNVKGAFIVKYVNGKRQIDITDDNTDENNY